MKIGALEKGICGSIFRKYVSQSVYLPYEVYAVRHTRSVAIRDRTAGLLDSKRNLVAVPGVVCLVRLEVQIKPFSLRPIHFSVLNRERLLLNRELGLS